MDYDELLNESKQLEILASKLQNENISNRQEIAEVLIENYHNWYVNALMQIPEYQTEKFRKNYDNGIVLYFNSWNSDDNPWRFKEERRTWKIPFSKYFKPQITAQRLILLEAKKRPLELNPPHTLSKNITNDNENITENTQKNSLELISKLARRFYLSARELKPENRRKERNISRPTITIENEYDVQDFFRAILKLHFNVVLPEETMPSTAGTRPRVDLFLKEEGIFVELKMTRKGMDDQEVGRQISLDKMYYKSHPGCKVLIAFIFDPNRFINRPEELENSLSEPINGIPVTVIISQNPV